MEIKRAFVATKSYEKSFKKFTANNEPLKLAIKKALLKLLDNPYDPSIRTHKLSGKLVTFLACSCGYDCRIIFTIEKDKTIPALENIILVNIGTHNDVY